MNVGVIGSGFIVPIFIETTKLYKDYHLRAIWGRHLDKLEKFKDEFDYLTDDIEKLLNDKEIDVVYIALPNKLHYNYALLSLKHNKHVILEKPFTVYKDEAFKLINYAKDNHLIIFEAILTRYNPLYIKAKEYVKKLGEIKIITANFSQYSRRYEKFKNGIVEPVFNKEMAGGALLDLNSYNVHFIVEIFGQPKEVYYYPNITNGIDTSGILILDYDSFKATLVGAKDAKGDNFTLIEGDGGYLRCNTTASRASQYTVMLNGKEPIFFGEEDSEFVGWKYELKEFLKIYNNQDFNLAYKYNLETLKVQNVLEKAIKYAKLDY